MNAPAVSVIIGTYNCSDFLPGLWACLDAQTYRDFEIVVVDDASDDGKTLPALENMGDRIRLIRRSSNSATCELPRYQGVKNARAPLCAFLDADDRWDPAYLQTCVSYMIDHPDAALVHTYARVIDGNGNVQHVRHEGAIPSGRDVAGALLRHCFITISSVTARRSIWLDAMNENEIIDFGMDQDFFVKIARKYPIGFVPEVLISYRRSDSSVSVKKWKRVPRNVNTLVRIYSNRYWEGVISARAMRRILSDAFYEDAEYWRHAGYPDRARWFCVNGLKQNVADMRLWKCLFILAVQSVLPRKTK